MKKIILLSCILIMMPLSVIAATITINVPGVQPTIQAGIDAAKDGDIVLLADGTYTGDGNYNIDLKGKSITVKSSGGPENCIIDCQQNGRGFLVYLGETVTFEGLTVNNGDAGSNDGGGIYANESEIIVVDCIFNGNSASYDGGAVSSPSSSSSFTNCTFTSNEATAQGGAIWCYIPLAPEDPITLKNCILWGNTAPEGPEIYEQEKPLVITYSDIQGGHAGTDNIDTNPFFIHAESGNVHLLSNSPCIDTGTATGAPTDDLDGNPRPMLSGYDMGAYEVQGISDNLTIDAFIADPSNGGVSLTTNFTCVAHDNIHTITGYQWNFGDGNTDNSVTGAIQHTYIIPGTFTATCYSN